MKLGTYMATHDLGPVEMARRLGVTHTAVVRYRDGLRRPGPDIMCRLYDITGGCVAPNDFFDLPATAPSAPTTAAGPGAETAQVVPAEGTADPEAAEGLAGDGPARTNAVHRAVSGEAGAKPARCEGG